MCTTLAMSRLELYVYCSAAGCFGKGHLAAQHDERSGNQRSKQFHYLCPNSANE